MTKGANSSRQLIWNCGRRLVNFPPNRHPRNIDLIITQIIWFDPKAETEAAAFDKEFRISSSYTLQRKNYEGWKMMRESCQITFYALIDGEQYWYRAKIIKGNLTNCPPLETE